MDLDDEKMPAEEAEFMKYGMEFFHAQWDAISKEMGQDTMPQSSGDDNSLLGMRQSVGELAVSGVLKLVKEQPERAAEILSYSMDDPDREQHADAFLHNAAKKTMEVMDYPGAPSGHARASCTRGLQVPPKRIPCAGLLAQMESYRVENKNCIAGGYDQRGGESASVQIPDPSVEVEEQALAVARLKAFWDSLDEEDRELLELKKSGMTQKKIADERGYKTHTAVIQGLQKLKAQLEQSE